MSKRRIIVPNPKIEKNDIGKRDKKFNDIYTNNIESVNISTDNINTEKINGEIIDEERYLENQFTIIYPGGGDAENPGNIVDNSTYITVNPFSNYVVNLITEVLYRNEWSVFPFRYHYGGGSSKFHAGFGVVSYQHNDNNIITIVGQHGVGLVGTTYSNSIFTPSYYDKSISYEEIHSAPARIKIWKVGKIK